MDDIFKVSSLISLKLNLFRKEKCLEIVSFLKFEFRKLISHFIAVLVFIPLLICKLKNKPSNIKIWFIYISKYQKDILFNLLKLKYNINLYRNIDNLINNGKIYQLSIDNKFNSKEISSEYYHHEIKYIFIKLITLRLNIPKKIYLSSVSPLLFPNLFIYGIILVYKHIKLVEYIDDGLSGNIINNRLQNLNFCPEPKDIYSWDFKNYFNSRKKVNSKKLNFKILYKLILEEKALYEFYENKKINLVVSSKYLDYDQTRKIVSRKKNYKNNTIYLPHPRAWKNSSYFLKNFKVLKTNFVEAWIIKNASNLENIYIGVSATTLVIAELKLLQKMKINIHLFINEKFSLNNSRKELLSFLDSAIASNAYKRIIFNGKRIY